MGKHSPSLKDVLSNVFDSLQIDEDSLLLPSFAMEGFIIQGSTFLDFYFQYICALYKTRIPGGRMPFDQRIYKALSEVETPFTKKAQSVSIYCKKNIFNNEDKGNLIQGNWGGLIKLIRNQMVHRDSNRQNYQIGKETLEKIFSRLPNNENAIPLPRFCQDLNNGMYYLITSLSQTIYGLEWKPGPYKTGMWDSSPV